VNIVALKASVLFLASATGLIFASTVEHGTRRAGPSKGVKPIEWPSGEISRGALGKHQIAITFDAGADAECFSDVIDALDKAGVKSTFFITGRWAQANQECARQITQHGHEIGNHTWNHVDLTLESDAVVRDEISHTEVFLNKLCQQNPRPLWRAPFGARDPRVLRIAQSLGYYSIYWTLDSLDSTPPPKTPAFLIERIASLDDSQLEGAIILMHVGEPSTAHALPAILENLRQRGFHLVTVSDLLRPSTDSKER
jgi:peptidoglycan/xylan/chitin deacetylase (PgdA/CDA1 family)